MLPLNVIDGADAVPVGAIKMLPAGIVSEPCAKIMRSAPLAEMETLFAAGL